jgi:hypothetical protein
MSRVLTHREISPRRPDCLAGAGGFEPPHGGIKIHTFLTKNNGLHVMIAATLYQRLTRCLSTPLSQGDARPVVSACLAGGTPEVRAGSGRDPLLASWIASCSSGSISASQVGQRSLQRQSHSSHQFVPQRQAWCFRNHGIDVVLIQTRAGGHGGFRDRLLATAAATSNGRGTRPVRSFSGTRANSDSHGESYSLLEVGRATRMLVRTGMRLRRRRKRPKPACRSNLQISAAVLGSPRPMARV